MTGQAMERESITIYRVACGQIAENWIVQDNLTMLRQIRRLIEPLATTIEDQGHKAATD